MSSNGSSNQRTTVSKCGCSLLVELSRTLIPANYGTMYERCQMYNCSNEQIGCGHLKWVEEQGTSWQKDAIQRLIDAKERVESALFEVVDSRSIILKRLGMVAAENNVLKLKIEELAQQRLIDNKAPVESALFEVVDSRSITLKRLGMAGAENKVLKIRNAKLARQFAFHKSVH
ncbi:uncharacterized protein LOC141597023 [Silene latifolia]|uniref:uncharacterized protein LOC141597023 n=1 Tax=Silene latifolia TaxID=37657 RepID=UPI003D786F29